MDDRPRPTFSANELRASLGIPDIIDNDPDAMTVMEIVNLGDMSEGMARRYIKVALEKGTWISVGLQRRLRSNGAAYYAEAYKPAE